MRTRVFSAVTAGALALAIGAWFAPAAGARPSAGIKAFHAGRASAARVHPNAGALLYDQNNNDSYDQMPSQNFETPLDDLDASGADSFKVPKGQTWTIKEVDVTGRYGGPGPAVSENVTFYKNSGGLPGAVIKAVTLTGTDSTGSFAISGITGVKLKKGTYWVSVQANMDHTFGEWFWETRTVQSGPAAAWENPGNGWGPSCTTWAKMQTCIADPNQGPDFMFALRGKKS